MSLPDRKTLGNDAYDGLLYTAGAVGISMVVEKIFKEPLGTPKRLENIAKLALAVTGGIVLTKWMQRKGYVPDDPFK